METLKLIRELKVDSETFKLVGAIIISAYIEGATDALKLSKEEIKLKVLIASKEII